MELFSPPRVTKMAASMGLPGGVALDLQNGWDFLRAEDRDIAEGMLKKLRPTLLICSPPCTAFSVLQRLNWRRPEDERAKQWDEAVELVLFPSG